MSTRDGPFTVLGAAGFTGRLVVERAREAGLPLRLVGRRREALEALAGADDEIHVADARSEAELLEAFEGASVVASLAGPFLPLGPRPVAAAIAVGAHYVDVTGEQAFARLVYEGFGDSAAERDVVLLTAFGFLYAVGDLAARLAADGVEPVDDIAAGYSVEGFRLGSSGTRRTVGIVMSQPVVRYEDGALVRSRFGASTRAFELPSGRDRLVEWSGAEALSVPRHARARRVRSYVHTPIPVVTAQLARLGPLGAPLVRLSGRIGGGPSEAQREATRWTVVAEAKASGQGRRATLTGHDVYGLTALLVVRAAEALRAGEVAGAGALAPAEAFDPTTLLERLAPLAEPASVQEI